MACVDPKIVMANVHASKKFVASFRTNLQKLLSGTHVISAPRLVFFLFHLRIRLLAWPGFCFQAAKSVQSRAIITFGKKTNT
jgi:hypothetical protein